MRIDQRAIARERQKVDRKAAGLFPKLRALNSDVSSVYRHVAALRRGLDAVEKALRDQDYGTVYIVMDDEVVPHVKHIAEQRYDPEAAQAATKLHRPAVVVSRDARWFDDMMTRNATARRQLIRLLAKTTRLPRGEWFKSLPDKAQNAWNSFEKLLDRAGADYIEQSDQKGGAVLLVQDPPNLRGIAVHLFGPSDLTHYDRRLHEEVPVAPAHLTVWDQGGSSATLSLDRWKKGLSKVKRALGLEVEEPGLFEGLLQRVMGERRDLIAALLQAGRPELANVVAKTPTGPAAKKRKAKPKPKDDDPVQSTTGRKIRDSIGHLPQFKGFEPDAWNHLGNHVKKYANTTVVFTGAISALLLWAFQKGKLLPMTRHYGIDAGALGVAAGFLKPNYQDRYLDFLEDGGVLEKTTMTTKQALAANHTKQDEKNAKERPNAMTAVYTAGEALPGIVKLLAKYGARLGTVIARTQVTAAPAGIKINEVEFSSGQEPEGLDDEFATTMMVNFTLTEPLLSKFLGVQSRVLSRKLAELQKARPPASVATKLYNSKVGADVLKALRPKIVGLLVDHLDQNVSVSPRDIAWESDSDWQTYKIKGDALTFELEVGVLGKIQGGSSAHVVQAGRRQVVYLGNTGPNGAREWVVVQYRNLPNGNGEKVVKISARQGIEPGINSNFQWSDIPYMRQYLRNMRHKLSRPGVMLLNKLARV